MLVPGRLRPDVLGGTRRRVLRRRGAAHAAPPVAGRAAGRGRAGRPAGARRVPAALAGGAARRAAGGLRDGTLRGVDGVARVVEQLAGAVVPASALETLVLPARVVDYTPAMLDELPPRARCVWAGHGALAGARRAGLACTRPPSPTSRSAPPDRAGAPATPAARRGAGRRSAAAAPGSSARSPTGSAQLRRRTTPPRARRTSPRGACGTSSGPGTSPTTGSARCARGWAAGATAHRTRAAAPRGRPLRPRLGAARRRSRLRRRARPRSAALGLNGAGERRALVAAARRASRTRRCARTRWPPSCSTGTGSSPGVAPAEGIGAPVRRRVQGAVRAGAGRAGAPRVLRRAPRRVAVRAARRGRPAARRRPGGRAVDADRRARDRPSSRSSSLAATDPANPYGASLPWPVAGPGPGRTAGSGAAPARPQGGALVVLVDGALVLYLERGGRTVLSFTADPDVLARRRATGSPTTVRHPARPGRLTDPARRRRRACSPEPCTARSAGARGAGLRPDAPRPAPAGPA